MSMVTRSCGIAVSKMKKEKKKLKAEVKKLQRARGRYNKTITKVRSACGKPKKFVKKNYAENPLSSGGILGF